MLHTRWSAAWSERATRITSRRWLQPAVYSVPFVVASTLLTLPWTTYTGFVRQKQYALMNLTFVQWLTEQAISLVVTIIATAIVFAGPLRDDILTMARENGIPADDVYVFDQSRQTDRISANVSGIGPTVRICTR